MLAPAKVILFSTKRRHCVSAIYDQLNSELDGHHVSYLRLDELYDKEYRDR